MTTYLSTHQDHMKVGSDRLSLRCTGAVSATSVASCDDRDRSPVPRTLPKALPIACCQQQD
jgi:hypothetical protein